jgi:hypothetical protein
LPRGNGEHRRAHDDAGKEAPVAIMNHGASPLGRSFGACVFFSAPWDCVLSPAEAAAWVGVLMVSPLARSDLQRRRTAQDSIVALGEVLRYRVRQSRDYPPAH